MRNEVICVKDGKEEIVDNDFFPNLKIVILGEKNIVKINGDTHFLNSSISIAGNNNYVEINETKGWIRNVSISFVGEKNGRSVRIGKNFDCGQMLIVIPEEGKEVCIGNDCLFSDGIHIRTDDGHVIYDATTEEILNETNKNVVIGDRVWVARNVYFGKGTSVGNDCVVGYGSVVTKSFSDSNVVIAGHPAKIIKRNIRWNKKGINLFKQEKHMKKQKIIAIIPARYQSSRFPGKPLALILGKPMIQWVYERVSTIGEIEEVYVATDDQKIYTAVKEFGGNVIMTGDCECGTVRVFQASESLEADIILNIQGDEPMIRPEMVEDLINAFSDPTVDMATLKKEIKDDVDIKNPNIAKVVTDINNNAILFSRSVIPYNRDNKDVKYYKHIGIYGYKKEFLKKFVEMPQSCMEKAEQLEQLRVIENGYKIKVLETKYQSIGVDLPEHIKQVESALQKELEETK